MPYKLLFDVGISEEVVDSRDEAIRRSKDYILATGQTQVSFRDVDTGYDVGVRKAELSQMNVDGHSVTYSHFAIFNVTSAGCCTGSSGTSGKSGPKSIADLMLWLKADALHLNDGDPVSFWIDSSGNNNNATQTTLLLEPIYKANELNSLPIVRFSNQNLGIKNFVGSFTAAEIFWTIKANPGGGLHSFGNSGKSFYPLSGDIQDDFARAVRIPPVVPTLAITDWRVYNVQAASGAWTMNLDNRLQYNYSLSAVSWGTGAKIYIGRDAAESVPDFFDGDIAEVIMYKRVLTSTERTTVKTYLYNKYNLTPGSLASRIMLA